SVSSTPSGASIYLDGAYKGTTPKTIRSVPIGSHTVGISKEGYHDETKSVSVKQDQTTSVAVHLTLQTGSIDIVGPDGASVYLDDVYKGTAPTTISNIPVGTYKITVEKFGYTTWRQTVNVRSRSAVTVTPDMVFLPMVTYNSVPLGAIAIVCIVLILLVFLWLFRWRKRKKSAQQTTSARKPESEPKTSTSTPLSPSSEPTSPPEPVPDQTPPPTSEPIPPSDFTPRPTTPTTFPPELVHLYSDPVYAGKGGFARVFKAKRKSDNKTVAVKIPISLDEGTGRSFLREITSWQRLCHENIITLYDANILPIPYLEMEYADSGSLDQMNKPVSIESASEIILGIAEGLAYSHEQGVIHRDLKPMNVLLTKDFTPKISDWGLSKIVAESRTSSVYGFTPLYASPEQVSPKKFGKPDERTDIYQLGVIFYELLTGRTPFEGDDLVEVSTAIATEEPEPPSELNPEAEIIDPIILKCLAKKKEDRYQNITELQDDLASSLKTQLKESLRMSGSEQNMKRSAFYCAEICLIHARLDEIDDVMTYLKDMQNYASEEVKIDVAELLKELECRKGMSSEEKISEEFVGRLKNLLHQVRMGR
ncbi:MAG: PEGA domain-containing protein, partial [Methanosarcinales archaeon]|nr:PEGA domain-containing protein [Candidatus Ethanoperedens thermophilum]